MSKGHWQAVYQAKAPEAVSWHQAEPLPSLGALDRLAADLETSLIDIGGGASRLIDALVDRGWSDLSVLDIAESALAGARTRLGTRAAPVDWIAADITRWQPQRTYDVWHDRAAFHFLTKARDRAAYREAVAAATDAGSHVILATFAPDGPDKCSGLDVRRYDAGGLAAELGPRFAPVEDWREAHVTPWGAVQHFQWAVLRRR